MSWVKQILMIVAVCSAFNVQADNKNPDELFNALRQKINSIKDYKADVRMIIDISYIKVPPMGGVLYYKSPDKVKIVRKGGITILPKNGVNMSLNTSIPEGDATIIDGGYQEYKGNNVRILKVVPNDDEQGIILTKLWVDESRVLVLKTETTTKNSGTVSMELKFGKYAKYSLPDVIVFHIDVKGYKLPQGVTMDYDTDEMVQKSSSPEKKTKGKIKITYLNYEINKGISDEVFNAKS